MAFLTVEYYEQTKDYLYPHLNDNIYHYRKGNVIELPPYHDCNHVNRNGTRRYIDYGRGRVYWARYMTQYGIRHLLINKGNLVFIIN